MPRETASVIPLDSILPELERAVDDRVESRTLASLDEGQLRDLVYKIVERNRTPLVDPLRHLSELVNAAKERHRNLVDAKEYSVTVRRAILEDLLAYIEPALPSLLGPIVIETWTTKDSHEEQRRHPMLLGIEILNRRKQGSSGDARIHSGQSYWIVALTPDSPGQTLSGRYATMQHRGKVKNGEGHVVHEISLIPVAEAAEQIRQDEFEQIVGKLVDRLLVVAGQKDPRRGSRGGASHKKERGKLERDTDRLWQLAEGLQGALEKIRAAEES